jgi:hypothetical protein
MGWTVTPTTQERGALVRAAECQIWSLYLSIGGEVIQCHGPSLSSGYIRFYDLASANTRLLPRDTPLWELSGPVQLVFDPRK